MTLEEAQNRLEVRRTFLKKNKEVETQNAFYDDKEYMGLYEAFSLELFLECHKGTIKPSDAVAILGGFPFVLMGGELADRKIRETLS